MSGKRENVVLQMSLESDKQQYPGAAMKEVHLFQCNPNILVGIFADGVDVIPQRAFEEIGGLRNDGDSRANYTGYFSDEKVRGRE